MPGGWGTRREAQNAPLLDWIALQDRSTELTTSVCTGAFLLAERGLLDNLSATTHWASLDRLQAGYPSTNVQRDLRYVDNGRVITSAGVSAGIDMSLHIVARLLGEATARETAKRMEYETQSSRPQAHNSDNQVFTVAAPDKQAHAEGIFDLVAEAVA